MTTTKQQIPITITTMLFTSIDDLIVTKTVKISETTQQNKNNEKNDTTKIPFIYSLFFFKSGRGALSDSKTQSKFQNDGKTNAFSLF